MQQPIIPASQLQTLSDWLSEAILTDSCAIQREQNNGTYGTVNTVACLLGDPTTYEANIADEVTGAVLKRVLFPRLTVIYSPDRFVINGITYRVQAVLEPSTLEVLRRVLVVRFPQRGGV
jgi:hypothetical protein